MPAAAAGVGGTKAACSLDTGILIFFKAACAGRHMPGGSNVLLADCRLWLWLWDNMEICMSAALRR